MYLKCRIHITYNIWGLSLYLETRWKLQKWINLLNFDQWNYQGINSGDRFCIFKQGKSYKIYNRSFVNFERRWKLQKWARLLDIDQLNYEYSSEFAYFCNFHFVWRYIIDPLTSLWSIVYIVSSITGNLNCSWLVLIFWSDLNSRWKLGHRCVRDCCNIKTCDVRRPTWLLVQNKRSAERSSCMYE